ncbi:MAG: element excision factor XisH family protein [Pseudanabaena sp.]
MTSYPLTIRSDRIKLEIDLGAEKVFAAEKDGKKIAVEVKSFVNSSNIITIVGRGLAFAPQFLNSSPQYRSANAEPSLLSPINCPCDYRFRAKHSQIKAIYKRINLCGNAMPLQFAQQT